MTTSDKPEDEGSKPLLQRWLSSDGAVLAVIPFAGTLVALVFEVGYLSAFGIPATHIQLDFTLIMASIAIVSFVALFVVLISSLAMQLALGAKDYGARIWRLFVYFFLLGGMALLVPLPPGNQPVLIGIMVVL